MTGIQVSYNQRELNARTLIMYICDCALETPYWLKSCARKIRTLSACHALRLPGAISITGTTDKRDNPEQGSICSQVISRRAHFSRRESGTCVLVAGPSEQLIEDAKDQSAHHRKDARRQRRFAHHAVYLQ